MYQTGTRFEITFRLDEINRRATELTAVSSELAQLAAEIARSATEDQIFCPPGSPTGSGA